jgi:hypothetical protein
MKTLLAAAALLFAGCALAQPRAIDLDQPGALEALARDHPAHFAMVERILSEAPHLPLSSVAGWLRTQYNVKEVEGPVLLRTSLPPQGRLSFVLGGMRYTKVIRVEVHPVVTPAQPVPRR